MILCHFHAIIINLFITDCTAIYMIKLLSMLLNFKGKATIELWHVFEVCVLYIHIPKRLNSQTVCESDRVISNITSMSLISFSLGLLLQPMLLKLKLWLRKKMSFLHLQLKKCFTAVLQVTTSSIYLIQHLLLLWCYS